MLTNNFHIVLKSIICAEKTTQYIWLLYYVILKTAVGIGGWLVDGTRFVCYMESNLHCTLKNHSLKRPLSSTDVAVMIEILDQSA